MLAQVTTLAQNGDGSKLVTPDVPWTYIAPLLILMVGGVVMLTIVSLVKDKMPRGVYAGYTVVIASAAFIWNVWLWRQVHNTEDAAKGPIAALRGALVIDGFSVFLVGLLCISVIGAALLADGYLRREGLDGPELYVLLLLSASGGAVMASAGDLIVLFIGLEILSIAAYVMAAMHSRRVSSQEAGIKYFLLGAFASAFLLYGIALTYGATGSTNLARIATFLSQTVITDNGMLLAGMALLMVGFGFKVAAVPFHAWTPDVYQGSPSPVTAFMASGVKVGAFAGLLRVFVVALTTQQNLWKPMVLGLAVASLVVGAVMAVVQTNVKRMMAYSSINHAGFILLGVEAGTARGVSAALFYLLTYTFMVIGTFGVITVAGRRGDGLHSIDDYRGLSRSRPVLALGFTVLLLAQAGTPFTGGFLAKLGVVSAAVDTHDYGLALIAMVTAVISAFLYLRIIVSMYFVGGDHGEESVGSSGDADSRPPMRIAAGAAITVGVAVVATLVLGIVPGMFSDMARHATATLVTPESGR